MTIEDLAVLALFRAREQCEYCRRIMKTGLDPNHVIQKGVGGGKRLDVKENLVSLCRRCHMAYHSGDSKYPGPATMRKCFFEIIAVREGFVSGEAVWQYLWTILNAPKEGPKPPPSPWMTKTPLKNRPLTELTISGWMPA